MNNFQNILIEYIESPNDPNTNWNLGLYYDSIGQTASAVSFYLRAAERTQDDLLKYECLLKSALCFNKQGSRNFTVKGLMQHAISILPNRPEAYFLLSRHYERESYDGHWTDCYMMASIGEYNSKLEHKPLRTQVEYPAGNWGCMFEKAVSSWWCGLCEESKDIFTNLYLTQPLDDLHYTTVHNNLNFLKSPLAQYSSFEIYRFYQHDGLKLKFPGSENIVRNFSEAFQDLFVLTILNGKRNGTYLEIGSGHPIYRNNTYLLEKDFEWTGISIDYSTELINEFKKTRLNKCIESDATQLNFNDVTSDIANTGLEEHKVIDYLQIDCDLPEITYQILLNIDFSKTKFRVITFEHDYYADSSKLIQGMANQVLTAHGYELIAENIAPDGVRNYEDWWVCSDLVDHDILQEFKHNVSKLQGTKQAKQLFLNT